MQRQQHKQEQKQSQQTKSLTPFLPAALQSFLIQLSLIDREIKKESRVRGRHPLPDFSGLTLLRLLLKLLSLPLADPS